MAIKYKPDYSKAYCRMGLAYGNLGHFQFARDSYKKAQELDPSDTNIKNLKAAEENLEVILILIILFVTNTSSFRKNKLSMAAP